MQGDEDANAQKKASGQICKSLAVYCNMKGNFSGPVTEVSGPVTELSRNSRLILQNTHRAGDSVCSHQVKCKDFVVRVEFSKI